MGGLFFSSIMYVLWSSGMYSWQQLPLLAEPSHLLNTSYMKLKKLCIHPGILCIYLCIISRVDLLSVGSKGSVWGPKGLLLRLIFGHRSSFQELLCKNHSLIWKKLFLYVVRSTAAISTIFLPPQF